MTESAAGVKKKERFYIGGYEVYREYDGGSAVTLERQTLHVMDDKQRVALVETRTQGSDGSPAQLLRYQFSNHLGSASLELDDQAQVISYEEYCPYGNTSYQAGPSAVEVSLKRYRYTGMERDEESGLEYHSARYYSPWLGRWMSCDPLGMRDGPNLYEYVECNPIKLVDPLGTDDSKPDLAQVDQVFNAVVANVGKIEDVLRHDVAVEENVKQSLSGLLAAKQQNPQAIAEKQQELAGVEQAIERDKNTLAQFQEVAYQLDELRRSIKRPDWYPDAPSQVLGAIAGVFASGVGVPTYYVKTEVSRQAMTNAQTGPEYFEARDQYNAACQYSHGPNR